MRVPPFQETSKWTIAVSPMSPPAWSSRPPTAPMPSGPARSNVEITVDPENCWWFDITILWLKCQTLSNHPFWRNNNFHPWRCSGPTSDVSAVQNAHPKELRVLTLQFFHHLPAGRLLWMDFRCDFSETVSHSGFNPEPTTFGPDSFHAS